MHILKAITVAASLALVLTGGGGAHANPAAGQPGWAAEGSERPHIKAFGEHKGPPWRHHRNSAGYNYHGDYFYDGHAGYTGGSYLLGWPEYDYGSHVRGGRNCYTQCRLDHRISYCDKYWRRYCR